MNELAEKAYQSFVEDFSALAQDLGFENTALSELAKLYEEKV